MNVMSRNAVLVPKQPAWLMGAAIAAAIALAGYATAARLGPWQPGRLGGLTAGTLAAALYVNAALYPARRRWRAWPLGTAQRWLQLHIYGSVLATVLVFVHVGLRLPAGTMGWSLLGLALWTAGTGLLGVYLQKALPLVLTRNLQVEVIYERAPDLLRKLVVDADAVMSGASEVLDGAYRSEIRPLLQVPRPQWSHVMDPQGGRSRQLEPLAQLAPYVEGADRDRLSDLETIVKDKLDLDTHLSLQRALRYWLVLHVPPAMLLLGVLAVHVIAVIYL